MGGGACFCFFLGGQQKDASARYVARGGRVWYMNITKKDIKGVGKIYLIATCVCMYVCM